MTEATIQIPGNIKLNLVSEELMYKAFAIALEKKRKEINKELKKINNKITRFEKKYNMEFDEFQDKMGDAFQTHDDWMEWSFLQEKQLQLLADLEALESN